jgi:hypothetical protein
MLADADTTTSEISMRARRAPLALILGTLLLLLFAARSADTAPKPKPKQKQEQKQKQKLKQKQKRWSIFRAYPGARRLCGQHVSGKTMHISWTLYATKDSPARVRRFYEKNASGATIEREKGKLVRLRGPKKQVLEIHGVKGKYPRCGTPPSSRDQTVIIVSQAT